MTCPAGHETEATDYCDVCGIAMDAASPSGQAGLAGGDTGLLPATQQVDLSGAQNADGTCPHCQAANPPNALFCEACGYDFTTGTMPRPVSQPDAAAVTPTGANPSPELTEGWVAEIWIDPDWYADQKSTDPLPSPGLPVVVPLRHQSVLIGRASRSRNITPDIDLSSDSGISRRHAQLTTDGTRWFVEDLGSSNGTYVGGSVGSLPSEPIPQGQKTEIGVDDRIYLGAWTRVVVRKASAGEL